MNGMIKLLKEWKLPVAMILGVIGYFVLESLPLNTEQNRMVYDVIQHDIQPVLIFMMLFLSFVKVSPQEMRPHRWQAVLLVTQGALFMLCSVVALLIDGGMLLGGDHGAKILAEGAMLCFLCPTATASAVIVGKLGGNVAGDVTYIILVNLMVSILAPAVLPLVEPHEGMDFITSFCMILRKVFPLLIFPLAAAWMVRYALPKVRMWLTGYPDMAFYLWLIALALAILVTVRSIADSTVGVGYLAGLALISLVCCIVQFALGRRIGGITAGQAFGQKNTVFAIWLGLVFLNPLTSVVGGFYSVWHNVINSWQLHKKKKGQKT